MRPETLLGCPYLFVGNGELFKFLGTLCFCLSSFSNVNDGPDDDCLSLEDRPGSGYFKIDNGLVFAYPMERVMQALDLPRQPALKAGCNKFAVLRYNKIIH